VAANQATIQVRAVTANSNNHGADPFERIERAILRIGWLGQRQFLQLLSEERFDLTIPQFHTLMHLSYCEAECKMSDLARATHQSAASLTGVVDRLLEKRLVARVRPEGDRRQVMVTLTDDGRALLVKIAEARRMDMRAAMTHIPLSDIDELLRLLDAVIDGMLRAVESREGRY
jgi:MarR family transcriptional regulator, organic hydroperoxide resistance regulator